MWISKVAIAFAFLAIISLTVANVKRENSLVPPFAAESDTMLFWDLTGSAHSGETYIRLTPDEEEKQGGIWNNFICLKEQEV